jgi:hypothetical protein
MSSITSQHLPSRKRIALRAGKSVAKSKRGRALAFKAGRAVVMTRTGRKALMHVAKPKPKKHRLRKGAVALALGAGVLALLSRSKRDSRPY